MVRYYKYETNKTKGIYINSYYKIVIIIKGAKIKITPYE